MKRVIGLFCLVVATASLAEERPARVERDFGNDHFAAGCPIRIDKPVAGDLIAAGCSLEIDANLGGDAALAGGHMRLNSNVAQGLYAVGGQVSINGAVGRNARVAGGRVEFGPKSEVAGSLSLSGGQMTLNGKVNGYLLAIGGKVLIDGVIAGDVDVTAGQFELGPNARIGGNLRYASGKELRRDAAAQVQGTVTKLEASEGLRQHEKFGRGLGRAGGWLWTSGLLVIAALLVAALPDFFGGVADTLRTRFGMSVLLGFVALVCVPVAALIFIITLIGIPLALLTIALYLVLLVIGYVTAGISLGALLLRRAKGDQAPGDWWRVGAAVLGVLLVSLLARIPWLGIVVASIALLAGMGALSLRLTRSREGTAQAGEQ